MKRMWWMLIALALVGCSTEPSEQADWLLSPGRPSLLRVGWEVQESRLSRDMTMSGSSNAESPTMADRDVVSSSHLWALAELPVQVSAVDESEDLRVTMTVRRAAGGQNDQDQDGSWNRFLSSDDLKALSPSYPEASGTMAELRFDATVNKAGHLASTDIHGGHFDEMRDAMEKGGHEGVTPAEMQRYWEHAIYMPSPNAFSGLEDLLAYLPPDDAVVGSSWSVQRDRVYPYWWYVFGLATHAAYSTERSTCRVTAAEQTRAGRSVTVAISGRRFPQPRTEEERVAYLDISGMLRVNVDTWESAEFYMASDVHWHDEFEIPTYVYFMERAMLVAAP